MARTRILLAPILSLVLAGIIGCSSEKAQSAAPVAVPITASPAVQKTVPLTVRAIGEVEAFSTVEVKSHLAGQLVSVHFSEGQDVKRGQLLFTFDRRPTEAMVAQAQGNLAKAKAELAQAETNTARYAKLMQEGVVARERYEQEQANMESLRASVEASKGTLENAKVQLSYTTIYSPIDGRTGSLQVHAGNMVKADEASLVVINQLRPIYTRFTLPEPLLPQVKAAMARGKLKVEALVPKTDTAVSTGYVSFVDNAVNRDTGTIALKGEFVNEDRRLWPGQFVDVTMTLAEVPNAILVPTMAVQTGQQGQYVYVVKNDMTVETRAVKIGAAVDDQTVVQEGLQAGERVVTDGQMRLVPGARVEIKHAAGASGSGK
ncbi:MAG: efflux RND transporter periplasmic adaptor subunit [Candidatus Koribacter versatilis]|uniref:Efflux RND transporter periplasmic adaptor subunit n=1 Tax=Candidatus Korobacter versatilis TaxID=658062 RepID=A0A932A6N9_9BACT|nr:efflux RND transporter periplasmic adaptor subunit [Candidatus Koribacter versatilis]